LGLAHRDFTINPFCLPPSQENCTSCSPLARVLIQSSGQYTTMTDDRDLYEGIENIYALDEPQRRLITLVNMLPRSLGSTSIAGCRAAPNAALFDNAEDTLTSSECSASTSRASTSSRSCWNRCCSTSCTGEHLNPGSRPASTLKLFILDEAWRFARDATVKAYITEALKTWRSERRHAPGHAKQR
jgi:type IV secretory pathway VirB4 component